jgi:hypothetical protein
LGHALALYRSHHRLDDAGLAEFLCCQQHGLARLKACAAPDSAGRSFKTDVQRIADFANCEPTRLLIVIREAHVLDSLRRASQPRGAAIAARDRRDKKPPEEA